MKRRLGLWLATSSFMLLLVACGGGGEQKPAETAESKPAESAAPAGPVTAVDPATAATITGKVSFEGEKPKPRQIRMDAEASCASLHKEQVFAEEVVVNDNKTLQYVFVYVKEGLGDKTFAASTEPVVLDQKGCLYTPHMIGCANRTDGEDSQQRPHDAQHSPSAGQQSGVEYLHVARWIPLGADLRS